MDEFTGGIHMPQFLILCTESDVFVGKVKIIKYFAFQVMKSTVLMQKI